LLQKKRPQRYTTKLFLKINVVFFVLNLTAFLFLFINFVNYNNPTQNNLAKNSDDQIIENLKKIYILPSEKYEIGTINNVDILKKEFPETYKLAENGDSIVIFPDRMVIYRVKTNQIINLVYIVNNKKNEY